jgi:molybdopterin-guanine dinucleotide biosynthesis protein A
VPSAAILAGGRARRFGGVDKSTLIVGGRPIMDRQIAELLQISDDVMLVGAERPTVPHGVRAIADRTPGCGPLGGLDAALTSAIHPELVVVACDMPFVAAPVLRHLLTLISLSPEVDAVVPRTERGYHPLCAVYRRGCQTAVARRLAGGRLQMSGLLDDLRVRTLTRDELAAFGDCDRLLANVNTPAELERLERPESYEP